MNKLILASTSVYRQAELARLNIPFECVNPHVDESQIKDIGLDVIRVSQKLALVKAQAVFKRCPDAVVIGGDQVATFDNQILSKPVTPERALEQLKLINGKEHRLITSVAILAQGEQRESTCIATLKMRQFSDEQLERYVTLDQPLQCCGSYMLEKHGIALFERIDCDDFTSIVGMPLMWLARTLAELGFDIP